MEKPLEETPEEPAPGAPERPARVPLPGWAKLLIVLGVLAFMAPVCLVGLGLAAALIAPAVVEELHDAQGAKLRADIVSLKSQVDVYALEHGGRYPATLEELLAPRPTPLDPWGAPYLYDAPDAGRGSPRVYTLGADGAPGGEGPDADIDDAMIKEGR